MAWALLGVVALWRSITLVSSPRATSGDLRAMLFISGAGGVLFLSVVPHLLDNGPEILTGPCSPRSPRR